MSMRKTQWALLMAAGVVALSGCGGSDDDTSNGAPVTPGPDSSSYIVTSAGRLVGFDLNNPSRLASANTITGLAAGDVIVATAFRPNGNTLYAVTNTAAGAGKLYTITIPTDASGAGGVATLVATLTADTTDTTSPYSTLSGTSFGAYFNPVPDRLRVVSNTGQNLRINVADGTTTTDATLNGTTTTADGVTYTNQFTAACRTTIYYVDTNSDNFYTSASPNTGTTTTVGALGVGATSSKELLDFTAFTGSATAGPTNTVYGVFTPTGGSAALYTINTTSGAATKVTNLPLASGETVVSTATQTVATGTPAQAPGDLFAYTSKKRLASFNVAAPTKVCSNAAVSGVVSGETLVGIDRRPSDGKIYGLSLASGHATGTLYTISNAGASTPLCAVTFATALTGTNFAINFNPVADALRVVSDASENLRIAPPTAAVAANADGSLGACPTPPTVDSTLTPATPVVAVSYTNSAAGATSTALYGIDTTNSNLVRIGADPATTAACPNNANPSCGVVTTVGPLTGLPMGTTLQIPAGFEINAANSTAYAALASDGTTAATSSTLYSVSTTNGTVTSIGAIGTAANIGTVKALTTK